jgi:hypothetical protein
MWNNHTDKQNNGSLHGQKLNAETLLNISSSKQLCE